MIYSDNSPFKAAEFKFFLRYHQINGCAEASIKSMTKLVGSRIGGQDDQDKLAKTILFFRNSPWYGGASPIQLVFNRPIRDGLQTHWRNFAPEWQRAASLLEERVWHALELSTAQCKQSTPTLAAFPIVGYPVYSGGTGA